LAAGIHETWRALSRAQGGWMQPRLDRPFGELAAADQEDNRAAARRIPDVLARAGMGVADETQPVRPDDPSPEEIARHIERHLERLAAAEHDGWMEQRVRNGWRQGSPRDDAAKIHPLIVPYEQLSEKEKDKDRSSVLEFPEMVAMAGHRIVWLRG
ncbi:MAG TPA: RyR domain-containing protein, partial [Reyranella sp.]|nr:RyR domain-containing protein [Reyranella sp.]